MLPFHWRHRQRRKLLQFCYKYLRCNFPVSTWSLEVSEFQEKMNVPMDWGKLFLKRDFADLAIFCIFWKATDVPSQQWTELKSLILCNSPCNKPKRFFLYDHSICWGVGGNNVSSKMFHQTCFSQAVKAPESWARGRGILCQTIE